MPGPIGLSLYLPYTVEIAATYFFCYFYFVHMLRSAITDVTSKSILLFFTSKLRPNCPATVATSNSRL
jgi:hypothetical protein